jgi:resuscitation-promoting factor RpfB
VSVAADGRTYWLPAPAAGPDGLLASLGLSLNPGDQWLGDGAPLGEHLPRSLVLQRAVDVTISDGVADAGATPRSARTAALTVGEALWALGYQLYAGDVVKPGLDTAVTPALSITIARSRLVTVQADGHSLQIRTRASTVGQALGDAGLALVGEDYADPAEDQPMPANGLIRVMRVREEILSDQQLIPFDTTSQPLPNVEIDTVQQIQAGVPGVQRHLTRVRYENGVEVARVSEAEAQVQNPVPQIIGYGTNIVIRSLDTPDGTIEYWRSYTMYATSYAAKFTNRTPGTSSYGRTASGKILTKGLVAIDRRLIPFGTRMYVPGYGFAEAADTGSGVQGRFVDLGFDDWNYENWHSAVTVYFLTPVPPADQISWIIPSTVP